MLSISLLLAAGSLPTLISGLPVPFFLSSIVGTFQNTHFEGRRESTTSYAVFGGNGETSTGWPAMSDWVSSFDTMFEANKGVMSSSCAQWGVADNSDDEIDTMSTSIQSVASSTGVDPRFILAIIMQESNGCVRAPTTNYGVRNPGLMQTHNGAGTCNDAEVSHPCPASEITQMIQDGVGGTSSGDGLKQCLSESGASDVSMYYKAARIYNSGSIDTGGNLGAGIATHCYASDVANRLIGWSSGPSSCQADTVGDLTGSVSFVAGSSIASEAPAPIKTSVQPSTSTPAAVSIPGGAFIQTATTIVSVPTTTIVSVPTTTIVPVPTTTIVPVPATTTLSTQAVKPVPATTTLAPEPVKTSTSTPTSSNPVIVPSKSADVYPGATTNCQEWYTVQAGDYCDLIDERFGIDLPQLISWNSGLDYACSNLWLGYQYCVKA